MVGGLIGNDLHEINQTNMTHSRIVITDYLEDTISAQDLKEQSINRTR